MHRRAATLGLFPPLDSTDQTTDQEGHYRRIQQNAGLQYITTGQCHWHHGLTHPLVSMDGVEAGPTVSLGDGLGATTQPIISGPISFQGPSPIESPTERQGSDRATVIIPGPYTLSDISTDTYYNGFGERMAAIASASHKALRTRDSSPSVVVHEPRLATTKPPDDILAQIPTALNRLTAAGDVFVMPYGDVVTEKVYAYLMDADIDALGFDLVADHTAARELITEFGTTSTLLLTMLEPAASMPAVDTIRERFEWIESSVPEVMDITTAVGVPAGGLRTVSPAECDRIIHRLAQGAMTD